MSNAFSGLNLLLNLRIELCGIIAPQSQIIFRQIRIFAVSPKRLDFSSKFQEANFYPFFYQKFTHVEDFLKKKKIQVEFSKELQRMIFQNKKIKILKVFRAAKKNFKTWENLKMTALRFELCKTVLQVKCISGGTLPRELNSKYSFSKTWRLLNFKAALIWEKKTFYLLKISNKSKRKHL